jgi:hypothetical protein
MRNDQQAMKHRVATICDSWRFKRSDFSSDAEIEVSFADGLGCCVQRSDTSACEWFDWEPVPKWVHADHMRFIEGCCAAIRRLFPEFYEQTKEDSHV